MVARIADADLDVERTARGGTPRHPDSAERNPPVLIQPARAIGDARERQMWPGSHRHRPGLRSSLVGKGSSRIESRRRRQAEKVSHPVEMHNWNLDAAQGSVTLMRKRL